MWNHQPLNFSVDTSAGFSSGKASGKNATMIVCFTAKLQIGQTVPSPWSPYLGLSKNRGTVDHKMARFNENHPLNLIQFESVSININVVSVVSIYIYIFSHVWMVFHVSLIRNKKGNCLHHVQLLCRIPFCFTWGYGRLSFPHRKTQLFCLTHSKK